MEAVAQAPTKPRDAEHRERKRLDQIFEGMEAQAESFRPRYRDLARYYLPTKPRFDVGDSNDGSRSNDKIINSIGTESADTSTSGLLQALASPAKPWFQGAVPEADLNESEEVQNWLRDWEEALRGVMDRSNFYTSLAMMMKSALVFGTGAVLVFEDAKKVIRLVELPIGSYSLSQNDRGEVDTVARSLTMTVREVVEKFGEENVSHRTRQMWEKRQYQEKLNVRHLIGRNAGFVRDALGPEGMPFAEWYWEGPQFSEGGKQGSGDDTDETGGGYGKILKRGGYQEFPLIAVRWERNHDDVYGTSCPGMVALGEVRLLQQMRKDYLDAESQQIKPPLSIPAELDRKPVSLRNGARNPRDSQGNGVEPVHVNNLPLQHVDETMTRAEARVQAIFYIPLFQMLLNDARGTPPTAEEVRAREREKLSVLGPILERFSDDLFDPIIDRISAIMVRRSEPAWLVGLDDLLPQPPDELFNREVRPVYVSEVAQAQRLIGLATLDRFANAVLSVADANPQVLDKFNFDAWVDKYAEAMSIDPDLVNNDEQVAAIRDQRARAQAAQAAAEQAPQIASAVRDIGSTPPGDFQQTMRVLAGQQVEPESAVAS